MCSEYIIPKTCYAGCTRCTVRQGGAKSILMPQTDVDEAETERIFEYYRLVREGKTNYIVTTAFHDVTGTHSTEPDDFFRMYSMELRPSKKIKH